MANDLEYSLGMNLSPLQQAAAAVGKWGDSVAKTLNQKFSAMDLFKGVLQGVGIASVQQVAERLVEPFKESAESAQRIAEYTEQAADATERLLALRRTDAQQLAALEKQMHDLVKEGNRAAPIGFFRGVIGGGAAMLGLGGLSTKLLVNEDANVEKRQQNARDQERKGLEIDIKKKEISERRYADELKTINEGYKLEKDRKAALERLASFERDERRAKLSDEAKLVDIQKEKAALDSDIAIFTRQQREGMQLTAQGADELLDKKQKQSALEKQIADLTDRKAKAEVQIGSVIDSNIDKWKDFVGIINSVGRGDKDLTDAELEKKVRNINTDLSRRQGANLGRYQGQSGTPDYDFFGNGQKSNLGQALAEQRVREEARRNTQIFGAERAFQMFGGSQERFDAIIRGYQTQSDKLNSNLDKLNKNVDFLGEAVKSLQTRTP